MKIETNKYPVKNVVIDYLIEQLPWLQAEEVRIGSLNDLLLEKAVADGSVYCNSTKDRKILLEMRHDQLRDIIDEIGDDYPTKPLCLLRYPEHTLLSVMRHIAIYITHEYNYAIDTVLELTPNTIATLIKQLENMKE